MSTLRCQCGHTIRDTNDFLPYKGKVRRDQDAEEFWETACNELALLVTAVAEDRRDEWISRHFLPVYPRDTPNDGLISDFLSDLDNQIMSKIYECEVCGRLWVQKQPGTNAFYSYTPDTDDVNRVLASARYTNSKSEPVQDSQEHKE